MQGCDGSILIGQTPQSSVERDSVANRDLVQDAFDTIDLAKQAVEAQCPGVVSREGRAGIWRSDGGMEQCHARIARLEKSHRQGAHTLGVSHCSQFSQRLYGVNTSLDGTDPSLDPSFAKELKKDCPPGAPVTAIEFFDKAAPFTFDNHYFKNLEAGRSLLTSDESLLASFPSREIVRLFARDPALFFFSFAASMDKLSRLGVKTGGAGEIRRSCNRFNAQ
ncbi:peroxidase 55 [Selaginella moellendorffii]|uniref:peroxidase 55 n=1 Tax=Selaginella moellendorffii TaxID=88036 RepID=UPI000D1CF383|nr:peroxidase 55 [Selaginella moellendorffii]|eukprot:XP_024516753.1 peroxidase 55 [Selaginella moellendorffii]